MCYNRLLLRARRFKTTRVFLPFLGDHNKAISETPTLQDVLGACKKINPVVNVDILKRYSEWTQKHSSIWTFVTSQKNRFDIINCNHSYTQTFLVILSRKPHNIIFNLNIFPKLKNLIQFSPQIRRKDGARCYYLIRKTY